MYKSRSGQVAQCHVLQKEVGQCEPWLALDGGLGLGLDSLTPICMGAADMLQSGGLLALETTGADLERVQKCGVTQ